MKPPLSKRYSDDFQTPPEALRPLIPFLKKGWIIWECAEGKGNLSQSLWRKGFEVIGSDVIGDKFERTKLIVEPMKNGYQQWRGADFLKWKPEIFNCIITKI